MRTTLCYLVAALVWILGSYFFGTLFSLGEQAYFNVLWINRAVFAVAGALACYRFFSRMPAFPYLGKIRLTPGKLAFLFFVACLVLILGVRLLMALSPELRPFYVYVVCVVDVLVIGSSAAVLYLLTDSIMNYEACGAMDELVFRPGHAFAVLAAFIVAVSAIPLVSFLLLGILSPRVESDAFDDLKQATAIQAGRLEQWLDQREHATFLSVTNPRFIHEVSRFALSNSHEAKAAIQASLISLKSGQQYASMVFLDRDRKPVFSFGEQAEPSHVNRLIDATVGKTYEDMHAGRQVRMDFVVPLYLTSTQIPLGWIYARLDEKAYLSSYLQYWARENSSRDFFLIDHSGRDFVFYRLGSSGANFTEPLIELVTDSILVDAIRLGNSQVKGAVVDKNVSLASWQNVTGTDWYVVYLADHEELLSPLKKLSFWFSLAFIAFLMMTGIVLLFVWRMALRSQKMALALREKELLDNFYTLPFIGMGIVEPASGTWIHFNDTACSIFRCSRQAFAASAWKRLTDALSQGEQEDVLRVASGKLAGLHLEKTFWLDDGMEGTIDIHFRPVTRGTPSAHSILVIVEDISERVRAQNRIFHLSRHYAALSQCNQSIVRSTNEADLFRQVCKDMAGHTQMDLVVIGLYDQRTDRFTISASSDPLFFERGSANGSMVREIALSKADGKSIFAGNAVFDNEAGASAMADWSGSGSHWQARAVLPLNRGESVVGAIFLYSSRAHAFTDAVRHLLLELVEDVNFALAHFRKAEQLEMAAQIFAQSSEGIMLLDDKGRIIMVNAAFTHITGYQEREAFGRNPNMLASGNHDSSFYDEMWRRILTDGRWEGEIWNRRKNGEIYPQWLLIQTMQDATGRTTHYIGTFTDLTERKETEERVRWLAHFDPLTGLPNRMLLHIRSSLAISLARRRNETLALMFLDLDNFKNVNDSLGHSVGDALLKEVATRLSQSIREQDTLSRLGGDEFVLILPGTTTEGAAYLAERLVNVASRQYTIDRHEINLSVSIGISMYPTDGQDFDTLWRSADAAMYRAKQSGRNDYCFFTREMQAHSVRTMQIDNALRRALEKDEFSLVYQPQMSLDTNRIIGMEALLRWHHPTLGIVDPDEFIPIAESNGLIIPIGEWVLKMAARQICNWREKGFGDLTVSVNLSSVQFRHGQLADRIEAILEDEKVPPECMTLELTESVAMENPTAAIAIIDRLRKKGVRFTVDDFGTGYSSLTYLRQFDFYCVKIDRTFIRDIDDAESAAIISAVINLAADLGVKTVAEGVETKEQFDFMRKKGCDAVQGFYVSTPLRVPEAEAFMRENACRMEKSS